MVKINICLFIALLFSLFVIVYLASKLYRIREQLAVIKDVLADIKAGNLNHRVLARESDVTKQICYDINEIAINNQARFIQQNQAAQSYRRLMTSLSHDVKTPLASLVGYLEAIENGLVIGEEKEEYLRVVSDKAHRLKEFVVSLFEWVKLDAKEQVFHFELVVFNELSRSIVAAWVPALENNGLEYEFEIPETEYSIRIDTNAYTRILNNLFQNIIVHSAATHIKLDITEDARRAVITLRDNGRGISPEDLLHIFERMYQCDHSRSAKGNGLGLSITKELVSAHKGTIQAVSSPGIETIFTIVLPKVL